MPTGTTAYYLVAALNEYSLMKHTVYKCICHSTKFKLKNLIASRFVVAKLKTEERGRNKSERNLRTKLKIKNKKLFTIRTMQFGPAECVRLYMGE